MSNTIPTVYTRLGDPDPETETVLAPVRLPSDIVDELQLLTVWLSLELGHQLPIPTLHRALLLGGLTRAQRVLNHLQATLQLSNTT